MKSNAARSWLIPAMVLVMTLWVSWPFQVRADLDTDSADDFSELENYITQEMVKSRVPGLSIAIFDGDDIQYCKGFGVKNILTKDPVDENTIFVSASISKTVTAYAALILVERGQLALDEPLTDYLKAPYLPEGKSAAKITLRMILTHTSGLSNEATGKDRKIYFSPGAHFSYSSGGFRYLQQVIEDVTEMPFNDFVTAEIFEPLGMESSSFSYRDAFFDDMAYGHYSGKKVQLEQLRKVKTNASFSMLSTPSDITRFAMEICDPTLLSPEMVAQMMAPAVKWYNTVYWGLGIGILIRQGSNTLWHWGNNVTYQNMMLINPQSKNGVVIMTNSSNGLKLAGNTAIKVANEYLIHDDHPLPDTAFNFLYGK